MENNPVEAIILAGGAGTRIAPVLGDCPKILAPIGTRPFLDILLGKLAADGVVGRVVVAAGHGSDHLAAYLDNTQPPLPVELNIETSPLGTGGALISALASTSGREVLVLNGDSFTDVDLGDVVAFHRRSEAAATIVSVDVSNPSRYGTLAFEGDRVVGFAEKSDAPSSAWINAGIYVINTDADFGPADVRCSLERDIMPRLIEGRVMGYRVDASFIDFGTPAHYAQAEAFFERLSR